MSQVCSCSCYSTEVALLESSQNMIGGTPGENLLVIEFIEYHPIPGGLKAAYA